MILETMAAIKRINAEGDPWLVPVKGSTPRGAAVCAAAEFDPLALRQLEG